MLIRFIIAPLIVFLFLSLFGCDKKATIVEIIGYNTDTTYYYKIRVEEGSNIAWQSKLKYIPGDTIHVVDLW